MTQMLRFKVKTAPNKTTVRKMLQALFLQHFNSALNGFILHGTYVCCLSRNLHYIFEDSIFSFGVLLLFCCYSKCTARNRQPVYTAESCSNESVFLFFSTKSEQTAIQQSHIINPLLTSFARSVRESIAFGFYRTDLAPSSLGPYENLRQYFPVQTSHSVNKSLIFIHDRFSYIQTSPRRNSQQGTYHHEHIFL